MRSARLFSLAVVSLATGAAIACSSGDEFSDPDRPPLTGAASACDRPIPALTEEPVTAERLETAITKMREVQTAAEAGGLQAANAAFVGDAHDITHDIDPPLREADALLAQDLCASIVAIEQELGRDPDLALVAAQAEIAAALLEDSARALGLE